MSQEHSAPTNDTLKYSVEENPPSGLSWLLKPLAVTNLPFRVIGAFVEHIEHYQYFGLDLITLKFDPSKQPRLATAAQPPRLG